ncbi:MAG: hypothetical protein WC937_01095 [Candidatus Omnitrophota bacterium]|jgi:NADH:ubiquinone oxidoreductase subunit 3 (subunit A)|nr:hypothetical protein [Candidatus Omnitrophota bacterium]MDD5518628.1 hypothetical protein [Candidatus Omnitrophota bacterium]
MEKYLVNPAVVFIIILGVIFVLNRLFSRLAFRSERSAPGRCESYACGEKNFDNTAQPDYSQFFSFVFFFTLAHVATLIVTSIPLVDAGTLVLAMFYIIGGIISLYILLRK